MSISFLRRWFRPLFVLAAVALFPTPLIPAPPAAVTVSISPTTATLAPGGSRTFTATVSGTTNTAVTWTYSGGSILGTGSTVTYTAPATTGNYTVTATSVASTTKKATATVTVSGPVPFPSLTITPASAMVGAGQSQAFTAKLTGLSNTAVGWRLAQEYSAGWGKLSATGTYVAGQFSTASSPGVIPFDHIEVYSLADPSIVARAVVGIVPQADLAGVTVTIPQPQKLEFVEGENGTFQATVAGATDTRVEWERANGANGGTNNEGLISVLGSFTAKSPNPWYSSQECWITLRAVSVADRTKWAYLVVRVWRKGAVALNPGAFLETAPFLAPGGKLQIAAEVKGGGAVTWSLVEGSGTVSTSGVYTAPATYQSAWAIVRATNAADATLYRDLQIPLAEPGAVTLTGDKWAVLPGGKLTFRATTSGTSDGVTWGLSLDGATWTTSSAATGSISKGTYTAPASIGSDYVRKVWIRAVNAKNASKFASGQLKVELPLEAAELRAPDQSWPNVYWGADYGWTGGPGSGGFKDYNPSNPFDFWSLSGNGTLLGAWYSDGGGPHLPNARFKTGAPGSMTLNAYPRNGVSSLTVSKVVQVVPVPDLSGVYSNGTKALRVLDFGTKTVIRPDGQSASMHRLWSTWTWELPGAPKDLFWTGRKLSGPGLTSIYSGYDAWSDAQDSADRNFAVDGLSLSDPTYKHTADVIIGVEPADFVVDGNWAIGPSIVYLKTGQTLQLQAAVGGTTNKAVAWSCPAGNGSVSATGLYTAPATPGTYTVTATAAATPNPSYSLKIRVGTLDNAPMDKVIGSFSGTVTPLPEVPFGQAKVKLFANGTELAMEVDDPDVYSPTFVASIMGGIRGCSAYFNNGSRALFEPQGDGTFLPQAEYPRQNGQRVAFGSAIRANEVSVGILPRINYLTDPIFTGATRTFTAQVMGTENTAVTWTAGNHNAYLSASGNTVVFTGPPMPAGYTFLDVTLRATSVADATQFDTVYLRIKPVPVTAVTPAAATINAAAPIYNSTQNFTASFPTQPSHDAFWSVQEGAVGGSINGLGQYTPGTTPGTYHVVATSQWDPTLKAQATVTVVEGNPYAAVTATPGTINSGQSVTVSWTDVWALNTPNPRLTLSIEDWVTHTFQTIDVTGQSSYVFSPAHTSMGTMIITSASGKTGERSSGWINVQSSAVIQSFTANPAFIRYGDPVTLTAVFTGTNGKLLQYDGGAGSWGPITSGVPVLIPAGSPALLNRQPMFLVQCEDAYGNTTTRILTVPCGPAIQSFTATPAGVIAGSGGSTALAWEINSAGLGAWVTLKARTLGGVETTYTMGSLTSKVVAPTETTDYTLTVSTTAGGESKVLRVRVAEVAALSLNPAITSLAPGASTTFTAAILAAPGKDGLSWTTTKGTLSGGGTTITYQAPQEVGTYTVTVASVVDPSVTATATVTVLIGGPGGGGGGSSSTFDITSFTAGPSVMGPDHRLLSWSTLGATGLSLRDSNGTESDVTGTTSLEVVPAGTTIYTLTATDGTRFISRTVTSAGEGYAIAVTPTKVTLFAGSTFKFSYATYAPSNRVTWTCDGGTFAEDGTYTAPAQAGTYTVTAALVDDPTKTSTATVTVNEISLQIEPGFLTLPSGQSFGFGYEIFSLAGDTPTWSASAGSILPNGIFTAPMTPGLVTITLTSSKDASKFATATVDVKPVVVMVFPGSLQMQAQGQYQFSAGTSHGGVTWSIVETAGGSISSTGLYTAPNEVGTYTVKAKSLLDPTRFGTARVVVAATGGDWGGGGGGGGTSSPVNNGVSVDPNMQSVDAGTYAALNATVLSSEDQRVTWAIANNDPRAKVDEQGVFTAHEPGIYTVQATSVADAALKGTAILEVRSSVKGLEGIPAALNLEGYSVTVLKDGKVLIAGGQDTRVIDTDPDKGYRGTAYLYDPETKAFTQVGNLLQFRGFHTATLLNDGRVLIAGGISYFRVPGNPDPNPSEQGVKWGEVFNPVTNLFEALPNHPSGAPEILGQMRKSHGANGASTLLKNGQPLIVGGYYSAPTYNFFDVFDPAANLFDLTDTIAGNPGAPTSLEWSQAFDTRTDGAVVALDDGRALLTGGIHDFNANEPYPCGTSRCTLAEARLFDPLTPLALAPIPGMVQPRSGHTMTKLPNGKILIVGGSNQEIHDGQNTFHPNPSATAEIFDPATGTFTPTGSMKWPRMHHAAILLPTGQVLVMGGVSSLVLDGAGGTALTFPTETEIYDSDTGRWEVMDKLAFGLDRPKLALMKDGGVFVAGKPIITASAGTPAAAIQEKGSRSVRSVVAPQTAGDPLGLLEAVFGTVAPSNFNIRAYPEEAALHKNPMTGNITADLFGMRPRTTRISIPRPGNANNRHRYFVLKVRKPSKYHSITGARVLLTAGSQSQFVLGQQEGPNGQAVAPGLFERIYTASDIPYTETITEERDQELKRKNWLVNWLPSQAPTDELTEYYRVRVTMDTANPSAIHYGFENGVPSPQAPSKMLAYHFRIFFQQPIVAVGDSFSDMPTYACPTTIEPHWDTSQYWTNFWYSNAPNGDRWVDFDTYNWIADDTRRNTLMPTNDFTLEHGRNTGHPHSHLNGRQGDLYHPGYTVFTSNAAGTSGSSFRDTYLLPTLRSARGWVEKDASGTVTRTVAPDPAAVRTLASWILAARAKIQDFMGVDAVGGFGAMNFIYLSTDTVSPPGAITVDCKQLRDLMLTGKCAGLYADYTNGTRTDWGPLDLSNNPALQPNQVTLWDIKVNQWIGDSTATHTHHLHLQWGTKPTKFLND